MTASPQTARASTAAGGPSAPVPLVDLHDVTVSYDGRPVLWNVDLEIDGPCLFGILGPNGAGKSTLVKAALGLVPLVHGEVRFFGEPLAKARGRIAYVPQRESVDWSFPVSALDVALMGTFGRLGWFRHPGRAEREFARDCLDRVGLADLAGRQIGRLSGGQQQRVFLARALAQKADIHFLDEPLAGVDVASQESMLGVLSGIRDDGGLVVIVHHDLRTAAAWFDRVALIDMRLVASGPTSEVLSADNLARTYSGRLLVLEEIGRAVAGAGRTP
jgi:manganese/zinc/iron transport system ATP- binding protein